jgi:glycine cleavage system H lipoate-binding protein
MFRVLRSINVNRINNIRNTNINTTRKLCNRIINDSEEWFIEYKDHTLVGITKKAIEEMTEIVYLDFEVEKQDKVVKDEEIVTLESIKSVESIKAPYDCIIIDTNNNLEENLDILNNNPDSESESWIVKLKKI